ncbi:DUF2867 domain-containing protein [Azospirillum sp. TSO22-1]|uniref:DUF2867 domain-containing protein n=1 Tax=Azospirillum sp. TSO22-1 TaxID=716789 RepID=UPI000D60E2FD|nr:DUF2867 domain-containing protein [Azospirillum sp. TSO22-1]PWC54887.1 hypothetical protein TSO221_06585 [Azospirillum sp. TSO22-1]
MPRVEPSEIPAHAAIRRHLAGADFHDAYRFPVSDPGLSALDIFRCTMNRPPAWIDRLMWLRNKLVRLAGLKDLGALAAVTPEKAAADYRPGDRLGIFTVQDITEPEIIVGDQDRHLDVWLSVCKLPDDGTGQWAVITTVVRTKNALGRFYMLVVKPFHRAIAPAMLKAYVSRTAG